MQFDFTKGDLSSRTIGSFKTHQQAHKAARIARRAELLSLLWLVFMVAMMPFLFGVWAGLHLH